MKSVSSNIPCCVIDSSLIVDDIYSIEMPQFIRDPCQRQDKMLRRAFDQVFGFLTYSANESAAAMSADLDLLLSRVVRCSFLQ